MIAFSDDRLDDARLAALVAAFYARVREDPELGPIFDRAVDDWDAHLRTLTSFWSSVMLGSGAYKGNPLAVHLRVEEMTPALFARWLGIWREVTAERLPAPMADVLQAKAARIAESLKAGLWLPERKS